MCGRWRRICLGCACLAGLNPGQARSADAVFDLQTLRARGVDPAVAAYLAQSPRFIPGLQRVKLRVNDRSLGTVEVRFSEEGRLCFDRSLLEAAHLQIPAGQSSDPGTDCHRFALEHPQIQVSLDPQNAVVDLRVPASGLMPLHAGKPLLEYDAGGVAGILNYDLSWANHRFKRGAEDAWAARTELGMNVEGWALRTNQILSQFGGRQRRTLLDAYAQRGFADQGLVLQLGQINLGNPVLTGLAVTGGQVFPEKALAGQWQRRWVDGIAHTEARLEVRQVGRLVHTALVAAGPFAVELPAQLDAHAPLQVTIIEASGERRERRLLAEPAAAVDSPTGFTFGLGTLRGVRQAPAVLSGGWNGALAEGLSASLGGLSSSGYQALGWGLGMQPWIDAQASATVRHSRVSHNAQIGAQGQLQLSQRLAPNWQVTLGYLRQGQGYRDFHDTLPGSSRVRRVFERDQYSLGGSWQHAAIGGLNLSVSQSRLIDGERSGRLGLAWSKQLPQFSVNAGMDWGMGAAGDRGRAIHLGVSVPLGGSRRLRTTFRNAGNLQRVGVTFHERLNDRVAYDLGLERHSGEDVLQSRIGLSLMSRYNQVRLDHVDTGRGRRSMTAQVRGGAVVHDAGLTLSAYPVQDTFALLSIGELAGVKVNTPSGPVWTDGNGRGVVPRVEPFGSSQVQVHAPSLPRNVELGNALAIVQAQRAAVSQIVFEAYERRRLLLHGAFAGQPLPTGAAVSDEVDGFITVVQRGGLIFLHDFRPGRRLRVESPELGTCVLEFQPADLSDPTLYYETLPAICRAV